MKDGAAIEFLERPRSVSSLSLAAPAPDDSTIARLLGIAARVPDHGKLAPWRFLVIEGQAKANLEAELLAIAQSRSDATKLIAGVKKLSRPPLCVAVISRTRQGHIPEWEQILSVGAVCMNLLTACLAMGFGANWITEWYAYDLQATKLLGLQPAERVAGMVMIGTKNDEPAERPRPEPSELTSYLIL